MQLLILNEEFLVNSSHQLVLITSLPFVHTARRYYRSGRLVRPLDGGCSLSSSQFLWGVGGVPRKEFELDRLEEVKVVTRFP